MTALRPTTDPTAPPAAIELVTEPERSPAVAERQQGAAGTASRPAGAAAARASAAYACTFVISADGSESDQFLAQLRAAVPESATSELALKARLGRWATTGWQPSDYTLGKTLGVGTFGKVKLATDPSGRQVAVKLISRSKLLGTNQLGRLTKEISILKCLRHPHGARAAPCARGGEPPPAGSPRAPASRAARAHRGGVARARARRRP